MGHNRPRFFSLKLDHFSGDTQYQIVYLTIWYNARGQNQIRGDLAYSLIGIFIDDIRIYTYNSITGDLERGSKSMRYTSEQKIEALKVYMM